MDITSQLLLYLIKRPYKPIVCGEKNTPVSYTIDDITTKFTQINQYQSPDIDCILDEFQINEIYNKIITVKKKFLFKF